LAGAVGGQSVHQHTVFKVLMRAHDQAEAHHNIIEVLVACHAVAVEK